MNWTFILIASMAAVGVTELIKNYLPENVNNKVVATIALVLSAGAGVGFGFLQKMDVTTMVVNTIAVIGLSQTSYNFVLKLLKSFIDKIKAKVEDAATSTVEKKLEDTAKELEEKILN